MVSLLLLPACVLQAEVGADCLRLSEVMAQPDAVDWSVLGLAYGMDWPEDEEIEDGILNEPPDWIELCNDGDLRLETSWYSLIDHDGDNPRAPEAWRLPPGHLEPGECLVVITEPDCEAFGCASFDLQQERGYIRLAAAGEDTSCLDEILDYERQAIGVSIVRRGGEWVPADAPTPGEPNP